MTKNTQISDFISKKYSNPSRSKTKFLKQKPFPNIEFDSFFDKKMLMAVKASLLKQKFTRKESDLFAFYQTYDLKNVDDKTLQNFISKLYSKDFVDYMQQITGLGLSNQVDIAGTCYTDTDYLLCHDDQLEGRKIAFLIYLEDMSPNEGGALALFNLAKNSTGRMKLPGKVVRRIIPKFNKFAFFEVSTISYHAVEEVVSDKKRLAIGGWFHGKK